MKSNFQKEQDALLKVILNQYINCYWKDDAAESATACKGLELFITPVCNQRCKYCYLVKHGNELYPNDIRDPETIISNMKILLEYLIEKDVYLPRLDLFSGEIWGMEFGNKILETLLFYVNNGLHVKTIMVPTNCSFITNDKIANVMDYYITAFKDAGVDFKISASIDGAVVEQLTRPFAHEELTEQLKTDEFYMKVSKFLFDHDCGFHPMIAAEQIEKQKLNYAWWHELFKLNNRTTIKDWYAYTMFLEVRNDNWTDKKIKAYLEWLNFAIDYDLAELFSESPIEFLYNIILGYDVDEPITLKDSTEYSRKYEFNKNWMSYNPMSLVVSSNKALTCTCGSFIAVRLGDLSIVPCHRTAYPKYIYGGFDTAAGKITDVTANNPLLMFNILAQGTSTMFRCDSCDIEPYCVKGCLGSQYESTGDIFYPIDSVCNFYKARLVFIYNKYKDIINKYNLEEKFNIPDVTLTPIYNKIKDKEEYIKWQKIVQEVI